MKAVTSFALLASTLALTAPANADALREATKIAQEHEKNAAKDLDEKKKAHQKSKDSLTEKKKLFKDVLDEQAKISTPDLCSAAGRSGHCRRDEDTGLSVPKLDDVESRRKLADDLKKAVENELIDADAVTPPAVNVRKAFEGYLFLPGASLATDAEKKKANLRKRILQICFRSGESDTKLDPTGADVFKACEARINKFQELLDAYDDVDNRKKAEDEAQELYAKRKEKRDEFELSVSEAFTPQTTYTFQDRMRGMRKVRCLTAFCWGGEDGTEYAIEPVLDIPISMYWAAGEGGLARHINTSGLTLNLNAGVRFWIAYDKLSIGLLLAEPELTSSQSFQIDASEESFTSASVSRPFPTLTIGILADVVSLSVSYDQLRNTNGSDPVDAGFRDNQVLSRTVTVGVSINTFTAMRNAFGIQKPRNEKEDAK